MSLAYFQQSSLQSCKNGKSSLYSLIEENNGNMQTVKVLPATMFESYGTIRFINEFPLIANALANGEHWSLMNLMLRSILLL